MARRIPVSRVRGGARIGRIAVQNRLSDPGLAGLAQIGLVLSYHRSPMLDQQRILEDLDWAHTVAATTGNKSGPIRNSDGQRWRVTAQKKARGINNPPDSFIVGSIKVIQAKGGPNGQPAGCHQVWPPRWLVQQYCTDHLLSTSYTLLPVACAKNATPAGL